MTTIYRVENGSGEGPYITGQVYDVGLSGSSSDQHPGPRDDGINTRTDAHYFGFSSVEQLRAWFGEDHRKALAQYGYRVGIYEALPRHVIEGRSQCCFIRAEATRVGSMSLEG